MERLHHAFAAAGYEIIEHSPRPFWMKFETIAGEDWLGQKLDLTTWKDEVGMMKWAIGALDSVSFFLVAIMVFIIVIGIINTVFMAVRERTREIGTMRAIGMQRSQILRLFVLEAALLGAAATTVGCLLGASLAAIINAAHIEVGIEALRAIIMSDTLRLTVGPSQLIGVIATLTIVSAGAALWPARKASRMLPVTAAHHAE